MNKNTVILLLIFTIPLIAYFYLSHSNESSAVTHEEPSAKIIKFTSAMCSECKRADAVIKEVYPKYRDKTDLISIDVQSGAKYNKDMVSKYKITLVPTIIFEHKNGEIYKRTEGYIDAKTLDKYLKELSND